MKDKNPSWFSLILPISAVLSLFLLPIVIAYVVPAIVWKILAGILIPPLLLIAYLKTREESEKKVEEYHRTSQLYYEEELGFEYNGEHKSGMRDGRGNLVLSKMGHKYTGDFEYDLFHGRGTMTWADGGKYDGSWMNGQIRGQGVMTWPDGRKYEGECLASVFNGSVDYKKRFTGIGEIEKRDSMPDGKGTMWWPDGRKYEGGWMHGEFNDVGILTYSDGRKYDGTWRNDRGEGMITWPSGDQFFGYWNGYDRDILDLRSGTFIWADGRIYKGGFSSGRRDSRIFAGGGAMTWLDGRKYEGGWKNDKCHGQGTMTWPDGKKYSGGFEDDKFHGFGIVTRPDGSEFSGVYTNGNYAPYKAPAASNNVASNTNTKRPALSEEAVQALIDKINKASDRLDEMKMENASGRSGGGAMGVAAKVVAGAAVGWGLGHIIFKQDSSK